MFIIGPRGVDIAADADLAAVSVAWTRLNPRVLAAHRLRQP
jgi:hypothetical protein